MGVASLEEGIKLREAGITQPIVLMEGLFNADEIAIAAQYDFTLVVHHLPQVEMLEKATVAKPFSVWLKINTGMHRLGIYASTGNGCLSASLSNACRKKTDRVDDAFCRSLTG